jgi:Rad3-related DNA helicase
MVWSILAAKISLYTMLAFWATSPPFPKNLLVKDLPYPLLRQGDLPRAELIHRFKIAGNAVLFGLKSFWEGVDIPGEALSLVVIDRLPFHPSDDPVHEARIARMKARKEKGDDEDWFVEYVLPQAVLQLKQGVGRLLRSDDDRGVIAILDPRLLTKGYGKSIQRALPPAPLATRMEEVERFIARPLPPRKKSP